jgi:hypothetical protein
MSNNNKGKVRAVPQSKPANVMAQMSITAFSDRPPDFRCTGDLVTALRLLAIGLQAVTQAAQQRATISQKQADPVDKKREYLGPRKD